MKETHREQRIALFIDCENISYKHMDTIMEKLQPIGEICIKKAYGYYASESLKKYEDYLIKYAIEPVHIITNGKNSCDIKIAIDVMNTLQSSYITTIALATSDSDFTSLASEIRKRGVDAIGLGEDKAKESLKNAFTSFEVLHLEDIASISDDLDALSLLCDSIENTCRDDGYALVSQVGIHLKNTYLKTAASYQYDSLSDLLRSMPEFFEVAYGDKRSILLVGVKGELYKHLKRLRTQNKGGSSRKVGGRK